MTNSQVGLLLGAILGLALIARGFPEMLLVAFVAAIGWVLARVIESDLDIGELVSSRTKPKSSP